MEIGVMPIDMTRTQAPASVQIAPLSDAELARARALVYEHTAVSLSEKKRHLIEARLAERVRTLALGGYAEYLDYIADDEAVAEREIFIHKVTTHKTSFFREPHHFDFLKEQIAPRLVSGALDRLDIWSAACSSGEEPYSAVMSLSEKLGAARLGQVHVHASDIDVHSVDHARQGVYHLDCLSDVSPERRKAHFLRGYGSYEGVAQVRPQLRARVEFVRLNLAADQWPRMRQFDVIFCRNVIIYFDRPTQQRLIRRLAGQLKPGGYLFSGHSENLYWASDVFTASGNNIYRKKGS